MASSTMRSQVLSLYRILHRTAQKTFEGDLRAIVAARQRIREEFKNSKDVTDSEALQKLFKTGQDVKLLLKTSVAQGVKKDEGPEGVYSLRIHEHLLREDNAPLPSPSNKDKR